MYHLNRLFLFLLAFSLNQNCQSQTLRYAADSFNLVGSVDSIWLYNQLVDTTKHYPKYHGKGYYMYDQTKSIQSIFQVYTKDTIGFAIEFFPNGNLASYYNYIGSQRDGLSYYFDTDGNLIRIGNRDRGFEVAYYIIKKNHKILYVNHLAKNGTKKRRCWRKLNKEEIQFTQDLKSKIAQLKNGT